MSEQSDDDSWSHRVAWLVVDALMRAGIIKADHLNRAQEIAQEEIDVRLALNDVPPVSR
jgi:hypothetical protein